MPVTHERDDARRLIIVRITDPYDGADILGVIDRQAAEDTWEYALLYDMQGTTSDPTEQNLRLYAERVRAVAGSRRRGPVAILIGPRANLLQIGQSYAQMIKGVAELELLFTDAQVTDWLERNARGGVRGPLEL